MDRPVTRRVVLGATAAGAVGALAVGLSGVLERGAPSRPRPRVVGYGPLVPDPAGILDLPEGFRYEIVSQEGVTRLDTEELSPSDPDGAAAFRLPSGPGTVLVCNHEVGSDEPHPVPPWEGFVYDSAAGGGTTTVEVDAQGRRVREYVSLAGTHNNCAGGRTPWDTWLSCEETETVLDLPHGFVFEVDPFDQEANLDPRPIAALGRFAHEAVVISPDDQAFYLTEDADGPTGLLYRWTPPEEALPLGRGSLRELADDAGTLAALRAVTRDGRHVPDLSAATEPGTTYTVDWVPVPDRNATLVSVRRQLRDDQVTRARKLEGMWWGDGGAFVVSSFARADQGDAATHDGQVWFLDPRAGTLTLRTHFAPPVDGDIDLDGPDNISVSPHGGLVIAEDGAGRPHLLGTAPSGEIFLMARGAVPAEDAEMCGPVFSPDEQTLFVNMQRPGYTFAIRGPFAPET